MNKINLVFIWMLCYIICCNPAQSQQPKSTPTKLIPVKLTCELRNNPKGIDTGNPEFGYNLISSDTGVRGLTQTAYQIIVSATPYFKSKDITWNSNIVKGSQMAYIRYLGKFLKSSHKYWWKVKVWDQNGHASQWSKVACWTMGMMDDWQAKWISAPGAEKYALSPLGYKSMSSASGNEEKWVQVDFGKEQRFSEVKLYPTFYSDMAGYGFPVRFKVESSNDAFFKSGVKPVADYTSNDFKNPGYLPVHISAYNATGRYVRITVTKLAKMGDKYGFSLRQIQVLFSGKNIASGKPVYTSDSDESNGFTKNNLTDQVEDYSTFPNYSSMMLRRDFTVKPKLVSAVIHISGLSQYELSINGQKIGDYLLTPGWTNYKKTILYDTYDVTQNLKSGNNTVGIILGNSVYNIQPDTLRYVKFITTFGSAKAIAQLHLQYADGTIKTIITDSTWQVSPGPVTFSNLYAGEDYDANLEPYGWNRPGFKLTNNWHTAIQTSSPGGALKGLSCSAPPVTIIDSFKAVKINRINDSLWIYDFGQNASMMPALNVRGPKGSYIRMIPSELLGENGLVDRASATQNGVRPAWWQYTLSGSGNEKWHPKFFYQGARYLQVELFAVKQGGALPQIIQLTDHIVHSSSTPVGSFKCSDTLFNKIYDLVKWAQRSNMISLMTDCPQREKMGWLEEDHLNGPSLRYNFNMAPLFRKTMHDMADAQLENGLIPNIAPEYFIAGPPDMGNAFRNSPEWGSSFIIVPWQQYLFSGDVSLLQNYYERMKRYTHFLSLEAKDHIIYTGLGDWYDIGPKAPWGSQLTPVSFTATAIYYYDNWIMYQIATRLGKAQDAAAFKNEYEQTRTAFNKAFYHPETGLYATGSQTCSAIPLFFNMVEPQNREKLLDALVKDIRERKNSFTTGEVGYRFLLRALADGGRSDVIFDMNNQSDKPGYGYQLKKGATSLTEKWDAGVGDFGSQNHFMSGQINEWFFNDLIGISPDENGAGFRIFTVKPAFLRQLSWVKGSYASVSGNIDMEWKKTNHKIFLNIAVPINTTANIYIPAHGFDEIHENGKPVNEIEEIKYIKTENNILIFNVKSGYYKFTIQK